MLDHRWQEVPMHTLAKEQALRINLINYVMRLSPLLN